MTRNDKLEADEGGFSLAGHRRDIRWLLSLDWMLCDGCCQPSPTATPSFLGLVTDDGVFWDVPMLFLPASWVLRGVTQIVLMAQAPFAFVSPAQLHSGSALSAFGHFFRRVSGKNAIQNGDACQCYCPPTAVQETTPLCPWSSFKPLRRTRASITAPSRTAVGKWLLNLTSPLKVNLSLRVSNGSPQLQSIHVHWRHSLLYVFLVLKQLSSHQDIEGKLIWVGRQGECVHWDAWNCSWSQW